MEECHCRAILTAYFICSTDFNSIKIARPLEAIIRNCHLQLCYNFKLFTEWTFRNIYHQLKQFIFVLLIAIFLGQMTFLGKLRLNADYYQFCLIYLSVFFLFLFYQWEILSKCCQWKQNCFCYSSFICFSQMIW